MVATEFLRNKYSLLKSRSMIAVVIEANLLALSIQLTITALFFLKRWICTDKYTNRLQLKHHSKNVNRHVKSGEYLLYSSVPIWISTPENDK